METSLPYGGGTVELKFLLLPENDDPDTFVRAQGPEAFRRLAAAAAPLSDFFVKSLAERVDFGTVDGRSRFEAIAKPLLKRLPEGTYRAAVMDAFGAALHLAPDVLDQMMAGERTAAPTIAPRPSFGGARRKTVVQKVINLALHYPHAAARVADVEQLAELNQAGSDVLRRVFGVASSLGDANTARLLENLRSDPDLPYLERIVAEPPLGIEDEEAAVRELKESLDNLRRDAQKAANVERIRAHRPGVLD
jgi:DNA primase